MTARGSNGPLPATEVAFGRNVDPLQVEMFTASQAGCMENFADGFRGNWLEHESNRLVLSFQLVVLFEQAKVDGLYLSVSGFERKIRLSPQNISSPVVGRKYPQCSWAADSRFVVDQAVKLPEGIGNLDRVDLVAEVASGYKKVGVIHVRKAEGALAKETISSRNAAAQTTLGEEAATREQKPSWSARALEYARGMNRIFVFLVLMPTLITAIYYGLIGSDIYVSESRFVVRSPKTQMTPSLGAMLSGVGFNSSGGQDDSYTVQQFILSHDALNTLQGKMDIRKVFSGTNVDIFSRFAGLDPWNDNKEGLYKYFQGKVDVQVDSASSIITLTTRAFTAKDSYRLNELLIQMSEALVNKLSERGRQDMIDFAKGEVDRAERDDKEATMALAQAQTGTARGFGDKSSLASKLSAYERLAIRKDVADKVLATAMTALLDARSEALQQQLYVERIAEPNEPDYPIEPRRLRAVAAVFVLGLVVWGILTMLIAGIREHQD